VAALTGSIPIWAMLYLASILLMPLLITCLLIVLWVWPAALLNLDHEH
jgi:hypothetical protein